MAKNYARGAAARSGWGDRKLGLDGSGGCRPAGLARRLTPAEIAEYEKVLAPRLKPLTPRLKKLHRAVFEGSWRGKP